MGLTHSLNESRKVELSSRGVSLHFLEELQQKYGQKNGYGLRDAFVIPTTNLSKLSLAELWVDRTGAGKKVFGDVSVFVSHAWSNNFGELVEAIGLWERADKSRHGVYYFLDIFALNQHKPTSDLRCIKALIAKSNTLLLILSPIRNPIIFSRAWCVFEIYTAIKYGISIAVGMSEAELTQFGQWILDEDLEDNLLWAEFDSESAKASVPEDAVRIKDDIRQDVGFSVVDEEIEDSVQRVMEQLCQKLDNQLQGTPTYHGNSSNWQECFKDTVARNDLLTLLQDESGVTLSTLVFEIIWDFLPTRDEALQYRDQGQNAAIENFVEGSYTLDDLWCEFDPAGNGVINYCDYLKIVKMSLRLFGEMRSSATPFTEPVVRALIPELSSYIGMTHSKMTKEMFAKLGAYLRRMQSEFESDAKLSFKE